MPPPSFPRVSILLAALVFSFAMPPLLTALPTDKPPASPAPTEAELTPALITERRASLQKV